MPQTYKRAVKSTKKKKHTFVWVVLSLVVTGAIIFASVYFYRDIKEKVVMSEYPRDYSEYVTKAAKDYQLDEALIYAVIHTESKFDPTAKSDAGAYGIMQIMPSTFEWLQTKRDCEGTFTEDDLLSPAICIDYGSYLIKYFLDLYGDEECAVAAYNAGFVVSDWLEDSRYSIDGKTLSDIPYPETKYYVEKVENAKSEYIKLYYS